MVGYICKYTPIEVIESFGEKPERLESGFKSRERAEAMLHSNVCSYVSGVLENILENDIQEVVLTSCCDSVCRLYDVLKDRIEFAYILALPSKNDPLAVDLFRKEIERFIQAYQMFKGKSFSMENLLKVLQKKKDNPSKSHDISQSIAILGARLDDETVERIRESCTQNIVDLTCTGQERVFDIDANSDVLALYAQSLLNFTPCMRMAQDREQLISQDFLGVIYNTVKFCDFYSYEYARLKNTAGVPLLKIETDHTDSNSGQILTRIEAFLESTGTKRNPNNTELAFRANDEKDTVHKSGNLMYTAGVDCGSTSTNVVIIDEKKTIVSYATIPTGPKPIESASNCFRIALDKAGLDEKDIIHIVATGYGRISIPFADRIVTEITCHGKGAFFLDSSIRTVVDIGGQDSKVIRLDDRGRVSDFVMNDKCSAGTGRFLEVMARTLGISLDEMACISTPSKEDITITSMCTVFAESEVISLIAQNKDERDIVYALNKSIASKITSLIDRVGRKSRYMMTGGVAKNQGVVRIIENKLKESVVVPFEPEVVGALGAALISLEDMR
ncbi:MAG TPA: acyl-CoA dehydratase activase [Bacillota bacterium]|nr:acyl-CoA dehydratase activase [Bacillota bacterium]